jgi:hypothetical protein
MAVLRAVLFDWGGTLMNDEWSDEIALEGHSAGIAALARDGLPDAAAFTNRSARGAEARARLEHGEPSLASSPRRPRSGSVPTKGRSSPTIRRSRRWTS